MMNTVENEHELIDVELWKTAAKQIDWFEPPTSVLGRRDGPNPYIWFPNGTLNTCFNCLDRHLPSLANQSCLIYDSPVTNTKMTLTYQQVLDQVQLLAGVLRSHGVHKGDTVLIYMPMVPEAVFGLLACARLGAVHSVVFGGFAPKELAKRIDDCQPKVVLTASCGIEPKRVIAYKRKFFTSTKRTFLLIGLFLYVALLESALSMCRYQVPTRIVYQRPNQVQAELRKGDFDYYQEIEKVRAQNNAVKECVPVSSDDPLYILYTSGTTGQPKVR